MNTERTEKIRKETDWKKTGFLNIFREIVVSVFFQFLYGPDVAKIRARLNNNSPFCCQFVGPSKFSPQPPPVEFRSLIRM